MIDTHLYKVVSVERTAPPIGTTGGCWYKYVIANGAGTITGYREGSREEVQHYARQCILRLNARDRSKLRPQGLPLLALRTTEVH